MATKNFNQNQSNPNQNNMGKKDNTEKIIAAGAGVAAGVAGAMAANALNDDDNQEEVVLDETAKNANAEDTAQKVEDKNDVNGQANKQTAYNPASNNASGKSANSTSSKPADNTDKHAARPAKDEHHDNNNVKDDEENKGGDENNKDNKGKDDNNEGKDDNNEGKDDNNGGKGDNNGGQEDDNGGKGDDNNNIAENKGDNNNGGGSEDDDNINYDEDYDYSQLDDTQVSEYGNYRVSGIGTLDKVRDINGNEAVVAIVEDTEGNQYFIADVNNDGVFDEAVNPYTGEVIGENLGYSLTLGDLEKMKDGSAEYIDPDVAFFEHGEGRDASEDVINTEDEHDLASNQNNGDESQEDEELIAENQNNENSEENTEVQTEETTDVQNDIAQNEDEVPEEGLSNEANLVDDGVSDEELYAQIFGEDDDDAANEAVYDEDLFNETFDNEVADNGANETEEPTDGQPTDEVAENVQTDDSAQEDVAENVETDEPDPSIAENVSEPEPEDEPDYLDEPDTDSSVAEADDAGTDFSEDLNEDLLDA